MGSFWREKKQVSSWLPLSAEGKTKIKRLLCGTAAPKSLTIFDDIAVFQVEKNDVL